MVAVNSQKLLGRNKKIQSEVDIQRQQLTAAPINVAVSQNILKSLTKITQLITQQNSQIVEIIREVKQPKSADVKPQQQLIAAPADIAALQGISKSLAKIIQLLSQQSSQDTAEANQERKNQENAKRKKIELGLENSFTAVKNVAQAVVAPVKSILDQIIQFFVALFLGKAILNLLDWFSKEENQGKIRSIARFLQTYWPTLVAAYILFGTGFGRVVRNLASIGLRAVVGLGGITLKLIGAIASALRFKKAGALLSGLGGGGGFKGLAARLLVGGGLAVGGALIAKNVMGGGETPQVSVPEPATLPVAEAFGGGLIDFKTMLAASGGQVDSKLGIFAQLFGSGGFAGLFNNVPGVVSGPKGIDKVPAMLTDGEFVMSRGAVQKFGVRNLEEMNAAGGGTNKPKIVQKRIHAYGGGFIGDEELYRQAANYNRGANLKEIPFDPKNQEHKNAYEKFKKRVVDKGLYKPSIEMDGPNVKTNVKTNVNTNYKSSPDPKNSNTNYKSSPKNPIVKSPGAGLSTNVKPPVQRINTNMNVPGGKGIGKGGLAAGIAVTLVEMFAPQIQEAVGNVYNKIGIGMGNLSDKELKIQIEDELKNQKLNSSGPGGALMGDHVNSSSYERTQLLQKELDKRNQKKLNQGGAIKDDKGRPFVGYKAIKEGKLQYSRGPQPGTGTSNPFEAFGRAINPGAYKDNDEKLAMKKQRVVATNSLESLQVRGASADTQSKMMKQIGGNLKDTQNDLNYRQKRAKLATTPVKGKSIIPTPKPAPKVYNPAGGGMDGRRGAGGGGSKGTQIPTIPAGKDVRKTANQLNIK